VFDCHNIQTREPIHFSFQYNRGSDSLLIVGSDQEIFTSLYTFEHFVYFGQSTTSYHYLEVAHPISCPASRIWFETSKSDHFMVFLLFFRTVWLPLHLSDHFQTVCCTLCRTVKIFRNIFPFRPRTFYGLQSSFSTRTV
jgi:hypothetical protein